MDFGRLITAMVTPFTEDGSRIDYVQTEVLIEHLLSTGSQSIVVAGTTGESPTLSHDEKISLFQFSKRIVGNRAKVIAGTSSNDTRASVALSKEAEQCGVDGLLLVTPYYSRPSQEGLAKHFAEIASATSLPCMLYNVPSRTGVNLEPETQIQLSAIPNIVATKEAGSFEQMMKLAAMADCSFAVYTGEDKMLLPFLSVGGYGVVSVTAHVIGREMQHLIDSYLSGDTAKAAAINRAILPVFDGMFRTGYPNPTLVKAALSQLGIDCGPLRLPLVFPGEEITDWICNLIKDCQGV